MKRFTEFRGTISRIDYDVERCTFDGVPELHPFLAGAPMGGDTDGGAGAANIAAQARPADTADAGLRCSALSPFTQTSPPEAARSFTNPAQARCIAETGVEETQVGLPPFGSKSRWTK